MIKYQLPDGWSVEDFSTETKDAVIIIKSPSGFFVTCNFNKRRWNTGIGISYYSTHEGSSHGKTYSGRGWQKALVQDAVQDLRSI